MKHNWNVSDDMRRGLINVEWVCGKVYRLKRVEEFLGKKQNWIFWIECQDHKIHEEFSSLPLRRIITSNNFLHYFLLLSKDPRIYYLKAN